TSLLRMGSWVRIPAETPSTAEMWCFFYIPSPHIGIERLRKPSAPNKRCRLLADIQLSFFLVKKKVAKPRVSEQKESLLAFSSVSGLFNENTLFRYASIL
ncbi:MAG: hypothetical protein MJZ70_08585, partial [Bacteroidales bacterium]|nr:hypothetical protein [Bacteroidales bacterium]